MGQAHTSGLTLPFLAAVTLSACAGGVNVKTHFDPLATPLAGAYRAWTWMPDPGGQDQRPGAPAVSGPVTRAVEDQLAAKQYVRRDSAPDFLVGWHVAAEGNDEVSMVNMYYGYTWGRWFPGGGVQFEGKYRPQFEPGTLVVDVVDARGRELVWRGEGRADLLNDKDLARRDQRIVEALRKMFERFPPR